ncbi:MAG: hypothetical protein ACR2P4_04935 [Gammaproteobacteria bacterium]
MTDKKTKQQIEDKKDKFLRGIFPGGYAEKTGEDFAHRAWTDTFRTQENMLNPFFAASAPGGSRERAAVQQFVKNKTMEIAGKIPGIGKKPAGIIWNPAGIFIRRSTLPRDDTAHIRRIGELKNAVTTEHGHHIKCGKLLFGRAQKMLNMYLKYMWCAKKTDEPPHCPFDDRVIRRGLPKRDDPFWQTLGGMEYLERQRKHRKIWDWSQSNGATDYRVWLAAAAAMKKRGGYDSIAEWELFAGED